MRILRWIKANRSSMAIGLLSGMLGVTWHFKNEWQTVATDALDLIHTQDSLLSNQNHEILGLVTDLAECRQEHVPQTHAIFKDTIPPGKPGP